MVQYIIDKCTAHFHVYGKLDHAVNETYVDLKNHPDNDRTEAQIEQDAIATTVSDYIGIFKDINTRDFFEDFLTYDTIRNIVFPRPPVNVTDDAENNDFSVLDTELNDPHSPKSKSEEKEEVIPRPYYGDHVLADHDYIEL